MENCKLCKLNPADKKNTHYLTDAIIRSCLNEGGSNTREKGLMFDMSSHTNSIEARFQRGTSQDALIEALGREPTEQEIKAAKAIPFSVDYVFCSKCEDIFTSIEKKFLETILPKLRGHNFKGITELHFEENITIRKFFLMQVYRTAVADPGYEISKSLQEKIRKIIENPDAEPAEILSIPLNISYLNTVGSDFEYTKNTVGIGSENGTEVIFFNDFIIQVYDIDSPVKFASVFGVNEKSTLRYFTNIGEGKFRIKVFDTEARYKVLGEIHKLKRDTQIQFYVGDFEESHLKKFGYYPHRQKLQAFIHEIIKGNNFMDNPRYSMERFLTIRAAFLPGV